MVWKFLLPHFLFLMFIGQVYAERPHETKRSFFLTRQEKAQKNQSENVKAANLFKKGRQEEEVSAKKSLRYQIEEPTKSI